MATDILNRLNELEAQAELIKFSVTALKQELVDGGAPSSSARKGVLPATEKARLLAKRQQNRIKKSHQ
ncbi:hypothetical protein [Xanthomarina gelatinilytica]|uniref:hypothetical protein n=1 Tax=Xanthomarina gelatinilytica TaxID=1137281 RepID=UPI003AA9053E